VQEEQKNEILRPSMPLLIRRRIQDVEEFLAECPSEQEGEAGPKE
jgi:hypothetical protein